MKSTEKLEPGDLVKVSNHPDATIFKVVQREGLFNVQIEESDLHFPQWIDICYLKKVEGC